MDLKQFDTLAAAERGFTYNVLYPYGENKGEPTDIKITVKGAGCREYKAGMQKIDSYKNKRWKVGKEPEKEILDEMTFELLANCTTGWEGMEEEGKALPFTKDNAIRLYEQYEWLRDQVLGAIFDMEKHLQGN